MAIVGKWPSKNERKVFLFSEVGRGRASVFGRDHKNSGLLRQGYPRVLDRGPDLDTITPKSS